MFFFAAEKLLFLSLSLSLSLSHIHTHTGTLCLAFSLFTKEASSHRRAVRVRVCEKAYWKAHIPGLGPNLHLAGAYPVKNF